MMTARANFAPALTSIKKLRAGLKREFPAQVAAAARIAAISCATSCQPFGNGGEAKTQGEKATAADIHRIYVAPGYIFEAIQKKASRDEANGFYKAVKTGNIARAVEICRPLVPEIASPELFGLFDGGILHRKYRNPRTGRVHKNEQPKLVVLNPPALLKYIAEKVKLVGFAKGSWANIARALGGIRGLKARPVPGVPEWNISAGWITRHKGSPMRILQSGYGNKTTFTLTSTVAYADAVLRPDQRKRAEDIARNRLKKQAQYIARYEARQALTGRAG
jgi:hypothetical protein